MPIRKGVAALNIERVPSKEEYAVAFSSRNGQDVHETMGKTTVGIAGLGGLGSNIAIMLARTGVGKLVIADFDSVKLPHLNRQDYLYRHLGLMKTDATEEMILAVNPYVKIEKHQEKITSENAAEIFKDCSVVCEAMDKWEEKKDFVNAILRNCPGMMIVAGSGMAGYGRSNTIHTDKSLKELYICGDQGDLEDRAPVVLSPRATICAGHMANTVLAIIMNGKV